MIYYQPRKMTLDGRVLPELPDQLWSFQVFESTDKAENWLLCHGYTPEDYAMVMYSGNAIENPTFIE